MGAGKSEALKAFGRHGAATISSDEIVHRLLRHDEEVRAALRDRFGKRVFLGDGSVDRGKVAELVFSDREQLAWLEALLHPRVVREYLAWRDQLRRSDRPPLACVTEVPLLFEVGGETRFDVVVVITAPPETRARRTELATGPRGGRLLPDEQKVAKADFAFVNDGRVEELDAFVASVLRELEDRSR